VLRDATGSDLESIRAWRNHPRVRSAHLFQEPIDPEMHQAWWEQVGSDPARRVLIFEWDGRPAGVVHFKDHDVSSGTAEWGFFLDIDGLGTDLTKAWIELEREAIEYAFVTMDLTEFGGRTLASNAPVLALHHRFGFWDDPERSYRTAVGDVDQAVIWTTLSRSAWDAARRSAGNGVVAKA
jgi:RimJ/RimL family protein N-acetyltransferase